ncbi:PHD finger protein 21A [Onthophagus taurus]|uniref:PHD finger protein 21A n=1 Tax=Onthophagus taurus TaxID=166361 RepID=UPI000C20F897|nr:PHD finger protein 21A isoform X1 [Onthophagus taurus]XP_022906105.1 PHD finger protein 21A isoform X1 [Onthophagus taurus]XP_022906106.1 PHD finger protein 21A isoform X2 [Onthophagus taurus]
MEDMAISKELKSAIESNQKELKNAIRNHQVILTKLRDNPDNVELQDQLKAIQENIVFIGCEQKSIIEALRKNYKTYQKSVKNNVIKNSVEEKRSNLTNSLNRARKLNVVTKATSGTSVSASDESECSFGPLTPEQPVNNPTSPHHMQKERFLGSFGLGTHEACRLLQNKRVERKRRSTANPQFLYHRGWDFSTKRSKRNNNVNVSPPHTRQAVRNRNKCNERNSPPKKNSGPPSPVDNALPFPLPSELTIERVNAVKKNLGEKICVECRNPGNGSLLYCDMCTGGFHLSCHNRPLAQTPRQCPRCISGKDTRVIGSLNVPSGMSVSYISAEINDKIQEKNALLEKKKNLSAELTRLQDKHSQLTITLKTQQVEQEELLVTQQSTEDKIQNILKFISRVNDKKVLPDKETVES